MKKFASITIAMLMVVSMMLSSIVSTSARTAGTGITQTTGSITLTKYETDSDRQEPVDGATFVAYKVMTLTADADGDATFTVDSDLNGVITTDDLVHTGKVGTTGKLFKSTKALEGKIPSIEALKDSLEATTFTATGNGTGEYKATDLGLGVYLVVETVVPEGYIKDTQSFLVSIPEWNGTQWVYDIEAQPKNEPITLEKKIVDPDKNDNLVNEAVFAIGNVVDYNVTAQIPNYGTVASDPSKRYSDYLKEMDAVNGTNKYGNLFISFTDTFADGLTFVGPESVNVFTDTGSFSRGEDYTVTVNGQTIEIKFSDWDVLKDYEGETITVEYQAVVNENAVIEGENKNEVTYKFVNDPDSGQTEELVDPAYVFSFAMNLNKTFEGKLAADAGVNATVVTFKLYRKGSTTPIGVIKNADGNYTVYDKEKDGDNTSTVDTVNLSATGSLYVKGLEEDTYLLEETNTVVGYAIPTTQIEIVLGEDGIAKTGYTHIGVEPTHCTGDGSSAPLKRTDGSTNTFEVSVNNVIKQFTLPTTGGDGLLIFTIAGGILMAAAIILFTTLRKKSTSK